MWTVQRKNWVQFPVRTQTALHSVQIGRMADLVFKVQRGVKRMSHLTILCVPTLWGMELTAHHYIAYCSSLHSLLLITTQLTAHHYIAYCSSLHSSTGKNTWSYIYTPHVRFHGQHITDIFFFTVSRSWLWSCWTGLWIKPLSFYLCSLLLNRFADQTTVLLFVFSAVEPVCGSNHCPVIRVPWTTVLLFVFSAVETVRDSQLSCYTVKISVCMQSHGVPRDLTGSDWRSQQGRRLAYSWHRPSDRDIKTTTRPATLYRRHV